MVVVATDKMATKERFLILDHIARAYWTCEHSEGHIPEQNIEKHSTGRKTDSGRRPFIA